MKNQPLSRSFAKKVVGGHVAMLALATFLVGVPASVNAAMLLQTDASWLVTPTDPTSSSNWNSSLSFDDSGWQSATILYDVAPYMGPNYAGTKAIWSSGGQYSRTETQVWIRKEFTLGALSAASLIVGCDDDCTVYVNGTQVINDTSGDATNSTVADLLPFLTVGTNLIAYTVTDNVPAWGYNHSTWLQLDGERASVPEPTTIALLGLGIAGLAALRRRKR